MSEKGGSAASFRGSAEPASIASGFCSKAYKMKSYAQRVIVVMDLFKEKIFKS